MIPWKYNHNYTFTYFLVMFSRVVATKLFISGDTKLQIKICKYFPKLDVYIFLLKNFQNFWSSQ